jgi:hypothetical protein
LVLHAAAAIVIVYMSLQNMLPMLAPVVPIGLLFLAWRASNAIHNGIQDREAMTKAIESTLGIHTIGCIWLAGCMVFKIVF